MKRGKLLIGCCLFLSVSSAMSVWAVDADTAQQVAEGVRDVAAGALAGAGGGSVIGATIGGGVALIQELDEANAAADKRNAELDQQLKDQKAELCKQTGQYCN